MANLTFETPGMGDNVARLDSLGEGYSLEDLLAVPLRSEGAYTSEKTTLQAAPPKVNLLVDIQAKLQAGKGCRICALGQGL